MQPCGVWNRLLIGVMALGVAGARLEAALPKLQLRECFPQLKLDRPVWMCEAPDGTGRFFILEQQGRIIAVSRDGDGTDACEFLNITNRQPYASNEEGLLGLAFHPGFATNRLFYIYYNQQQPRRSVISEWRVSRDEPRRADPTSERVLM